MTKTISEESTLFGYIKDILNYPANPVLPVTSTEMDDCALMRINDRESIAITSDFVRGSGFAPFRHGFMNYFDVGYYLISANLSDLAATGAKPIGLTTVIRYSDQMDDEDFKNVFRGMKESADMHGAQIIGGDVGNYDANVFAATAFGLVETSKALLRKNVRDDDLLCVTGVVGRPTTMMTYFINVKKTGFTLSAEEEEAILHGWIRPQARVKEGMLLSEYGLANACMDVSDGLKASIEQLSSISGKTFTLHEDKVPLHQATIKLAAHLGVDPLQIAMGPSVDFELLFTIPRNKETECLKIFADHNLKMTVIGEVNNEGKNQLLARDGDHKPLPGMAWKQQKVDYDKDVITKMTEK